MTMTRRGVSLTSNTLMAGVRESAVSPVRARWGPYRDGARQEVGDGVGVAGIGGGEPGTGMSGRGYRHLGGSRPGFWSPRSRPYQRFPYGPKGPSGPGPGWTITSGDRSPRSSSRSMSATAPPPMIKPETPAAMSCTDLRWAHPPPRRQESPGGGTGPPGGGGDGRPAGGRGGGGGSGGGGIGRSAPGAPAPPRSSPGAAGGSPGGGSCRLAVGCSDGPAIRLSCSSAIASPSARGVDPHRGRHHPRDGLSPV